MSARASNPAGDAPPGIGSTANAANAANAVNAAEVAAAEIQLSDPGSAFLEARNRAEQEWSSQQRRAVRMIAGQAHDRAEFTDLLSMLDLGDPALCQVAPNRRLADYVQQVALATGVPLDATEHQMGDTATAELRLSQRSQTHPDDDLILGWDERLGWFIGVESPTTKAPAVIAYLGGDIVPAPAVVARFVADAMVGPAGTRFRPVQPPTERAVLASRLAACLRP